MRKILFPLAVLGILFTMSCEQEVEPMSTDIEVEPTYTVTYHGDGYTEGELPVDNNRYKTGDEFTVIIPENLKKQDGNTKRIFAFWGIANAEISENSGSIGYDNASKNAPGSFLRDIYFPEINADKLFLTKENIKFAVGTKNIDIYPSWKSE